MVLEGASGPDDGRFDQDSSPTSDHDPYDSAAGQTTGRISPSTKLPRPVPIVGPLMGYTNANLVRTINQGMAQASQLLKRPIRQEEAEALAYNFAKMERTSSWGGAFGLAAGLYRAWSTAAKFSLPFFNPDVSKIDPDSFAGLKGSAARSLRHAFRGASYGTLGLFIGGMFAKGYAAGVMVVMINKDPALHDMSEAMKKLAAERAGRTAPTPKRTQPVPQPAERDPYTDDMSPQASSYDTGSGILSDRDMRGQEMGRNPDEPSPESQRSPYSIARSVPPSREPRDAFDDMSPAQQPPAAESSQGSAWDRIRKQAASNQDSRSTPRSNSPFIPGPRASGGAAESLGDSFSFSSTDEERQLAQSEAQKEFDARVEKERQGKDFSDGQFGKRW